MEKRKTDFKGFINFIKIILEEENKEDVTKGFAVREYCGEMICGEFKAGKIVEPFKVSVGFRLNLCQDLYDALVAEFGEELIPGYSLTEESYNYFMTLGTRAIIHFPNGILEQEWIQEKLKDVVSNKQNKIVR